MPINSPLANGDVHEDAATIADCIVDKKDPSKLFMDGPDSARTPLDLPFTFPFLFLPLLFHSSLSPQEDRPPLEPALEVPSDASPQRRTLQTAYFPADYNPLAHVHTLMGLDCTPPTLYNYSVPALTAQLDQVRDIYVDTHQTIYLAENRGIARINATTQFLDFLVVTWQWSTQYNADEFDPVLSVTGNPSDGSIYYSTQYYIWKFNATLPHPIIIAGHGIASCIYPTSPTPARAFALRAPEKIIYVSSMNSIVILDTHFVHSLCAWICLL